MKPPTLAKWKIKDLRRYLTERHFAIPKLQRNFVWDPRRAARLLDSLYRRMPVGSLFLWEMHRKSANLIRQSAELLPSFNNKNKHVWFVIDGQQRLTVIHQAFEAELRKNDAGREINFGHLCFVVDADSEQGTHRVVYRKPIDGRFVPIRDILAPDWKRRMPTQAKRFMTKIRDCRERLLSYAVPVVIVRSATLDEIGEIFIRVNSQGMTITSADRAIALMGKLDVRAMAQELRQKIRDDGFALDSIDPILMGFNLVTHPPSPNGDPPKLEAMARSWSRRIENDEMQRSQFEKQWQKYQDAFLLATDYLRQRFPVHDESYLPSANMLATLAVFFFHHPGRPNRQQAPEIQKWFWATGVAERYSGRGYHRNIVADAKLFESLAGGKRKRFVLGDPDLLDPVIDIQARQYSSRAARTRAFFCLLASRGPRYLENAELIPLGHPISHANRKDRHHVFPQAQLREHFSSSTYNSLCNICFLVARDNKKIGKRLPRKYLTAYRQDGRRQFVGVMRSHLIPVGDDSGVWDRGIVRAFKQFRQKRLALICEAFEKEAGITLFRKS